MSDIRFSWTEPKLCSYKFNLAKEWFVYFNYTDHLTGHVLRKQFRGGINTFKTKENRVLHGNALIAYWKMELKAGWNPFGNMEDLPVTRPTITEALDIIFELKTAGCQKRTLERYRYQIKLLKTWLEATRLQHIYLAQFELHHAQAYMDYLTLKKTYSGRTFNDHITGLSTFFNCMIDREWIVKNPWRKIKKRKVEVGRNIAFSDSEKEKLSKHLREHDIDIFYFKEFIYYCFIRRSELTRLKIANIDWKNMSIVVPSSASKNKKQESVVIPASFVSILKEMGLQDMPPDWYIFGRGLKPGPVQYINYNHISTRHNKICRALGIDESKGLYSWKHSGVCALYPVLNGDIYAMMRQLRHSELATTQIYLKSLGLVDNAVIRNAVW